MWERFDEVLGAMKRDGRYETLLERSALHGLTESQGPLGVKFPKRLPI